MTTAVTCGSSQDLAMSTSSDSFLPGLASSSSSEDLTDLASRMATTALPKPKPVAGPRLGGAEVRPGNFDLSGKQWWVGCNDSACTDKMALPKMAQQDQAGPHLRGAEAQAAGSTEGTKMAQQAQAAGSTEGMQTAQKGKKGKKGKKDKKK